MLPKDLKELLRAFNDHGVKYLIVGGYAFGQAWENRIEALVDEEIRTVVISKDDLIQNNLASGREQDVLDVKKLRAITLKDPLQD